MIRHRLPLLLLLVLAGPACANMTAEERQAKLDRAHALHDQATALRDGADKRYADADTSCRKKFFVNSCLDDAHQARTADTVKARELDKEARELERDVKRHDVAEREAERIREAPAKAAEAEARAARNREAAEKAQAEVAKKQAEAAARGSQVK
jgi:colicin import membrane protein